jgi:hypothetical protein
MKYGSIQEWVKEGEKYELTIVDHIGISIRIGLKHI